jgi:hypothetical protein
MDCCPSFASYDGGKRPVLEPDQLPPNGISALLDENQFSCHGGDIYMKGTALAR